MQIFLFLLVLFSSIHQQDFLLHKNAPNPLGSHTKPHIALIASKSSLTHEVFGFYPYWMGSAYYDLRYDLLSTIAYFSAEISANGNIIDDNGWPIGDLIDSAHVHSDKVVLTTTCFNEDTIRTLLAHPSYWEHLIDTLLTFVLDNNGDGVNIDFEGIYTSAAKDSLTIFMTALTDSFHNRNINSYVTLCGPAVDWYGAFDYDQLAYNTDGIFIMAYDYHWAGGDPGPVAPYDTSSTWGQYSVCWTIQDYITYGGDDNRNKFILGVPYYGYDWPSTDTLPGANATGTGSARIYRVAKDSSAVYGYKWDNESYTPYYTHSGPRQCWWEDSLSLSRKYEKLKEENFKGTGMWALGYDGDNTELWGAIEESFSVEPPDTVKSLFSYCQNDSIHIIWHPITNATSYKIYSAGEDTSFLYETTDTIYTFYSNPDSLYYFTVSALNGAVEGAKSQVIGCYGNNPDILLVYGYDRITTGENTGDFLIYHGNSFYRLNAKFASSTNDAVTNSAVSLSDYTMIDWILAEEGTLDETFSSTEQALVSSYLDNGGNFFVSGSEIGYDLYYKGTAFDSAFYCNYLHATYIADDANNYISNGTNYFNGLTISYDDGTNGIYDVSYPDIIDTLNGSYPAMFYNGTTSISGIYYEGSYNLVYLAFGFEAIYTQSESDSLMARILNLFNITFNLPIHNPPIATNTHSSEYFTYNILSSDFFVQTNKQSNLEIYDKAGRKIKTIQIPKTGIYKIPNLPKGLYFAILKNDEGIIYKNKILNIK